MAWIFRFEDALWTIDDLTRRDLRVLSRNAPKRVFRRVFVMDAGRHLRDTSG